MRDTIPSYLFFECPSGDYIKDFIAGEVSSPTREARRRRRFNGVPVVPKMSDCVMCFELRILVTDIGFLIYYSYQPL